MVWLMVHESWFCSWFGSWFGLWYMVHGVLDNVLLENGGLPFIFPLKVHLDFGHHCNTQWYLRLLWWNTLCSSLLTLRSTWGFYLNHLIPLRPFKSVFDNVLLEHGGLPHVLPLAVHLIFLPEQVEEVILSHFYSLSFLVRGLLHA